MSELPISELNCRNPEYLQAVHWYANKSRVGDFCIITRVVHDGGDLGRASFDDPAELLTASVHLHGVTPHNWWHDGNYCPTPGYRSGCVHVFDRRHSWQVDLNGRYDMVKFDLPFSLIADLVEDEKDARLGELKPLGFSPGDRVLHHLAKAVCPFILDPTKANRLLIDHICSAAALHIVQTYAGLRFDALSRGGLVPWQLKRVKEFMDANLHGNISLQELADLAGLSVAHFRRSFKISVGISPYHWFTEQRLARAQDLMTNTGLRLAEIASATGFANQSHLTRVFAARRGITPAAWRRMRRL